MKVTLKHRLLFVSLCIVLTGCSDAQNINTDKFLGIYERDKFVPADPSDSSVYQNNINWTIALRSENVFVYKTNSKSIQGNWSIESKDGEDYFISLKFGKNSVACRLNGTIIYFEQPSKLFDSVFNHVIFVKSWNSNVHTTIPLKNTSGKLSLHRAIFLIFFVALKPCIKRKAALLSH